MPSQADLRQTQTPTDHIRFLLSTLSAGELHNVAVELSKHYIACHGVLDPFRGTQSVVISDIPVCLCDALSRFAAADPIRSQPNVRNPGNDNSPHPPLTTN